MCDPSGVEPCGDSYSSVSKFVAEPFSALASIGLILAGSNAMHQSRKYNFETRFMVLGFSGVWDDAKTYRLCSHDCDIFT